MGPPHWICTDNSVSLIIYKRKGSSKTRVLILFLWSLELPIYGNFFFEQRHVGIFPTETQHRPELSIMENCQVVERLSVKYPIKLYIFSCICYVTFLWWFWVIFFPRHAHKSTVMQIRWNQNGNWLLTASRDHLLKLFDIRMMKEMQTFRGHKREATGRNNVTFEILHFMFFKAFLWDIGPV